MNVCPLVVNVVGPVIGKPGGKVKVTGFPPDPVRVITLDVEADGAGPIVNVCPFVVNVVGPVIEEPGGKVKVTGFPPDPVRVITLDVEADGAGPTVNVCPFVVTVVGPVIEEPGGKVKVTGFPPDPVRVTTFDAEADGIPGVDDTLGAGPTVNVCPFVVTVVGPVIEEPGGKVKVTGIPPFPVRVTTFDVEADGAPGLDDTLGAGPTVNVCPFVVTVVGPVIKEPGGRVKVTGFPPFPVRVTTFDVEADGAPDLDDTLGAGPTVNVCPLVVSVVRPVIEEPGGKVKVTRVPGKPVSVTMLDFEEEGNAVEVLVTVRRVELCSEIEVVMV